MKKISLLLAGLAPTSEMAQSPGRLSTGRLIAPMKRILIVLLFVIFPIRLFATTYYVKNGGNDGNTGLSDAQAWATMAKVNTYVFSPGDSILFKKGDIWRETLIVPSSGSVDKYITFSSYGTSLDKPKIYGSVKATTWTDQGNHVWKSAITFSNPYIPATLEAEVFFVRADATVAWGVHKSDTASLATEYDWTWSANSIYVYSTSNPDRSSIMRSSASSMVVRNWARFACKNGANVVM